MRPHSDSDIAGASTGVSANDFGAGRGVYISGLPYSAENARVLLRAVLWASHGEDKLRRWFSGNVNVDVHAYPESGKYCVVNNTESEQDTVVYDGEGRQTPMRLAGGEILWFAV